MEPTSDTLRTLRNGADSRDGPLSLHAVSTANEETYAYETSGVT